MKKKMLTLLTTVAVVSSMSFTALAASKMPEPVVQNDVNGKTCIVYVGENTSKGTAIYTAEPGSRRYPADSLIKALVEKGYEVVIYSAPQS